jgi:Family of unknown function (DUF5681)
MSESENSVSEQKPWQFQKGQSGNPQGKPKGALNHATRAAQMLLDGESDAITRKCIEMALAGDSTALRLCLERLVPPRKDRPISFALPKLESADDAAAAMAAIAEGVANGELTPLEARDVAAIVESFVKVRELPPRMP